MPSTRRRFLTLLGGVVAGSLGGCSTTPGSTSPTPTASPPASPTDSPIPTDTAEPTETDSPTPDPVASAAWTTDTLDGMVDSLWLPNAPRKPGTTGGPLYAGTDGGEIANIHVGDGTVRWRFSVEGELAQGGHPTLTKFGSELFVVSDTQTEDTLLSHLERVDPDSGDQDWLFEAREFLTPLGVVDDTVYVAGHHIKAPPHELGPNTDPAGEGRLHAIDATTGEERWETAVPNLSGAALARHGVYLTTDWEGDDSPIDTLVAFNLDGTERWRAETGTVHLPRPVPTADGVLSGYGGDGVSMLTPDGSERWHVNGWDRGPGQVEVTQDRVYVGSDPIVALDRDGNERWRQPVHGSIVRSSPEDRMLDTIYLERADSVTALSHDSGKRRWTWKPPDAKYVHVKAKAGDGILVTTGIGRMHELTMLGRQTGEPVGSFYTPMVHHSVESIASRVFIGSADTVYAYDVG